MDQPIKSINFNGTQLRYIPGAIYRFVAQDIAAALGYKGSWSVTRRVSEKERTYILAGRGVGASSHVLVLGWWTIHRLLLDSPKPVEAKRLHDFIVKNILSVAAQRCDNVKSIVAPKIDQYVRPQPLRMEPRQAVEVASGSVQRAYPQLPQVKRSGFNLEFIDAELPVGCKDGLVTIGAQPSTVVALLANAAVDTDEIVVLIGGQPVTTTLAIAKGTELDHASVIKLVRTYLADLEEFGRVGFEIAPFKTAGGTQQREIAILNEPQSTLLMTYMRNSDIVRSFKKRLVRAFFALAHQARSGDAHPVTLSRLQLIEMALDAERGRLVMVRQKAISDEMLAISDEKLAIAAPKADALDRLSDAEGSVCISNAAKLVGIRQKDAFAWLHNHQWIFRRGGVGPWVANADKLNQGLLIMVASTIELKNGREKIKESVRMTPSGLTKFTTLLGSKLPPGVVISATNRPVASSAKPGATKRSAARNVPKYITPDMFPTGSPSF